MARGVALSNDARQILVNMAHEMSIEKMVRKTKIPRRTIERVLSDFVHTGSAERPNTRIQPLSRQAYNRRERRYLIGLIRRNPDAFLDELRDEMQEATGKVVHQATVWRTLERNGFTMKEITREALERNADLRADFVVRYGSEFTPEMMVPVDESSFDRRTAFRGRAWALRGRRAYRKCFFVRGRRYPVLPAMSMNGIIHVSIVEGSFTAARFREFISGLLDKMQPYPNPNSVILMDNARIHKDPETLQMILDRGCRYCFLPPYSPDFNPIELAFSAIKAFVKRSGVLRREDLGVDGNDTYVYLHLIDAVYSVTPEDATAFFYKCGYL